MVQGISVAYILLDKCVVRGLSAEELRQLGLMHTLLIPPVLIRETLAEIDKYSDDGAGDKRLVAAAKKMAKTNLHILPNAAKLVKDELLGIMPVHMHGIPPSSALNLPIPVNVDGRGGSQGVFLGERLERKNFRDWSEGMIDDSLRDEAKKIRDWDNDIEQLPQQINILREKLKGLPKFKYFHDLAYYLRDSYLRAENHEYHLKSMAEGILDDEKVVYLLNSYRGLNIPYYKKFPYAFYYYWIRSSFTIGMVQEVDLYTAKGKHTKMTLSGLKNSKLHIDFHYLHYLPFCQIFASSDKSLIGAAVTFAPKPTGIPDGIGIIDIGKIKSILKKEAGDSENKNQFDQSIFAPNAEIDADEQSTGSKAAGRCEDSGTLIFEKQEISSLHSLSVAFLKGILLAAGCTPNCDWNEFRRSFNSDAVKRVFDFQANFWPPSSKLTELDKEARKNNILRCIYLGDLNEFEVKQQITRWSLYLDQILIPDPFSFAWLAKDDLHPMSKPDFYELWTMQILHCLLLLEPLINEGYIVFVPNPIGFDSSKREMFSEINFATPTYKDMERDRLLLETARARIAAGIPEDRRRQALGSTYGEQSLVNMHSKLAKDVRKNDPIWVERYSIVDPMTYLFRTSMCLEEALILSAFYQAVPILSSDGSLSAGFRAQSDRHDDSAHLNNYLSQLEVLNWQVPVTMRDLRKQEVADNIRKLLRDFVCVGSKPADNVMDSIFKDYKSDTNLLSENIAEKTGIRCSRLLIAHKMELLHSSKKFVTPQAKQLIEEYDSNILDQLPEYAISVPFSEVPNPFMKLFI